MNASKRAALRGFTAGELLVSVVLLGLILSSFMSFVAKLPDFNAQVAQHARQEGLRSWQASVMASGINPAVASVYSTEINPAVPAVHMQAVVVEERRAVPGLPNVVALSATQPERVNGAGFQLGAGGVVANPTLPVAPLPPIQMRTPVVSPSAGSVVPVAGFAQVIAGQPYRTNISSSVTDSGAVTLLLYTPASTVSGVGVAVSSASTMDFASGVSGRSWSEYAGDLAAGDFAVSLGDGRRQWYVAVGEQWQPYDPSPFVDFSYRLGLGAPVLVDYAFNELAAGGSVPVDYMRYVDLQLGLQSMHLDWPTVTKAAFGGAFGSLGIGFNWTFQGVAGPYSGDFVSFFQPVALALWTDSSTVLAQPVVPATMVASSATWTVSRVATSLVVPDLTSSAMYAGDTYESSDVNLAAPVLGRTRIGRVSAHSGAGPEEVSTGDTLSIGIAPSP